MGLQASEEFMICVAMPKEREVVQEILDAVGEYVSDEEDAASHVWQLQEEGLTAQVSLCFVGQGLSMAAAETGLALDLARSPLNSVFLVGTAGGLRDASHGDIVIGSPVFGPTTTKTAADGESYTFDFFRPPTRLLELAASIRPSDWHQHLPVELRNTNTQQYVGPVLSSDRLFETISDPLLQHAIKTRRDALAVEMEGLGFLRAAEARKMEGLLVKGISDLIDDRAEKVHERTHRAATGAAAACVMEMVFRIMRSWRSPRVNVQEVRVARPGVGEQSGWCRVGVVSATMLYLERYDDGSWGRSLWRVGGHRFSEDVNAEAAGEGGVRRQRRALSVTSWAAIAMKACFGSISSVPFLEDAIAFALQYLDQDTGLFGSLHVQPSSTPLVRDGPYVIANPRHTASALKLLLSRGVSRIAARSAVQLLRAATIDGSWGERLGARGNTLSTAYVLDSLLVVDSHKNELAAYLDESEALYLLSELPAAIAEGFAWLAHQQGEDGLWGYRMDNEYAESRPYYTAHIVCFLPQLFDVYPHCLTRLDGFFRDVVALGGVPEMEGQPPGVAPTAMTAFGLIRLGGDPSMLVQNALEVCKRAIIREVSADSLSDLSVMEAIFSLVLAERLGGQQEWTDHSENVIRQLHELRPYDDRLDDAVQLVDEILQANELAFLCGAARRRLTDKPTEV